MVPLVLATLRLTMKEKPSALVTRTHSDSSVYYARQELGFAKMAVNTRTCIALASMVNEEMLGAFPFAAPLVILRSEAAGWSLLRLPSNANDLSICCVQILPCAKTELILCVSEPTCSGLLVVLLLLKKKKCSIGSTARLSLA